MTAPGTQLNIFTQAIILVLIILLLCVSCTKPSSKEVSTLDSMPIISDTIVAVDASVDLTCLDQIPLKWRMLTESNDELYFLEPCDHSMVSIEILDTESETPKLFYHVGIDGRSFNILQCKSEFKGKNKYYYFTTIDADEAVESVISLSVESSRYDEMHTGIWNGLESTPLKLISEVDFDKYPLEVEVCGTNTGTRLSQIAKNPKNVLDAFYTRPSTYTSRKSTFQDWLQNRTYFNEADERIIDTINSVLLLREVSNSGSVSIAKFTTAEGEIFFAVATYYNGEDCASFNFNIITNKFGIWNDMTKPIIPPISPSDLADDAEIIKTIKSFQLEGKFSAETSGKIRLKILPTCDIELDNQDNDKYLEAIKKIKYNVFVLEWDSHTGKFKIVERLKE